MVLVPAGEFSMGIPQDVVCLEYGDDAFARSHPESPVYLSAFYIDRYPVTNADYYEFVLDMDWRPPAPCGPITRGDVWWDPLTRKYPEGTEDLPVVYVSWHDACVYCEWAGKRLPTEAEWEKAARGTDGRRFPWGNEWNAAYVHEIPVTRRFRGARGSLAPVTALPEGESPYGCRQMLGNVGEWCQDWYSESYRLRRRYRNPKGPKHGEEKVERGFLLYPHVAYREQCLKPWLVAPWVGFRCARDAR